MLNYCQMSVSHSATLVAAYPDGLHSRLRKLNLSYTGGGVLVHCQMGVSRSATLVVAYLMTRKALTFRAALTEVLRRRPVVQPNPGHHSQQIQFDSES